MINVAPFKQELNQMFLSPNNILNGPTCWSHDTTTASMFVVAAVNLCSGVAHKLHHITLAFFP